MAGVTKLSKVQLGLETSKGSAVDATALWLGPAQLKDNREAVFPDENIGYLGQVDRSYIPSADSEITFTAIEANYEQIGYPFAAGVADVVAGAANGGSSNAYKYAYTLATTAAPTTKAYTIEGGDNQQEYEATYGFCEEITLSGAPREAVKIASKWRARSMGKNTFTAAIAVPTVEQILFQNGKIYLDAVGGTLGATQLTNTWLGFDMTIKTGLIPVFTGDGSLYFSFDKCVGPAVTGSITFEHDAVGVARYDDFVAGTTKKVRMLFAGSATGYTGTGGTFTSRALQLDMSMKIVSVDPLASINGNNVVKINYMAVYNPTASLYFVATVCNLLSALT
jgi:hypothetical protein